VRDQFAPELISFSRCVLEGTEPEPSGAEGLADVRVIAAIRRSIEQRQWVELGPFEKRLRPTRRQRFELPPAKPPRLVRAKPPSGSS
jgi:hypothetical protein